MYFKTEGVIQNMIIVTKNTYSILMSKNIKKISQSKLIFYVHAYLKNLLQSVSLFQNIIDIYIYMLHLFCEYILIILIIFQT